MLLHAATGCGSLIVEAALAWADVPYTLELTGFKEIAERTRSNLLAANPLGQVPTLVLDDGTVLSESAAIVLWLDEQHPQAGLLPPRGSAARAHALRWIQFLVSAIYPTFTVGDFPERWVSGEAAQQELLESTKSRRMAMWQMLAPAARGPWFCGEQPSIVDVYLAVMTRWHPKRAWFAEHLPALHAISQRADALPALAPLIARDFPAA